MYIVDVNEDESSDFLFCFLRPAKRPQPPRSSFFNALTDVSITSWKTQVEVAKDFL